MTYGDLLRHGLDQGGAVIHRATLKAPAENVTGDVSLYVCTVCGVEATSLALLAQRPCQFPDPAKR